MSLLFSITSKRSLSYGRNVVNSTISKRSFSFSSSTWSQGSSHGIGTSAAGSNFEGGLSKIMHYQIAVAFQAKDREEYGAFNRSRGKSPAMLSPTGEDNYLVSKQSADGYIAVGVADGVGGWSEAGYDSSAISRELCAAYANNFEASVNLGTISPKELLTDAFNDILMSSKVEIGGTTACVGIMTPNYELKVANLGDSWCGLFRDYCLIEETNFQTHNFNTPYQLSKIPPRILRQAENEGRRYITDSPSSADEYSWKLQKDDLIMFATDGVTDNVIPKDIEIFLKDHIDSRSDVSLDAVSKEFVKQVVKLSKDLDYPSAFAQELSRITGQKYLGGKEDDITVLLIKVT